MKIYTSQDKNNKQSTLFFITTTLCLIGFLSIQVINKSMEIVYILSPLIMLCFTVYKLAEHKYNQDLKQWNEDLKEALITFEEGAYILKESKLKTNIQNSNTIQ